MNRVDIRVPTRFVVLSCEPHQVPLFQFHPTTPANNQQPTVPVVVPDTKNRSHCWSWNVKNCYIFGATPRSKIWPSLATAAAAGTSDVTAPPPRHLCIRLLAAWKTSGNLKIGCAHKKFSRRVCIVMLTPITAVGGVSSKLVCRDKDIYYLKENIVLHTSLPDLSRSIVVGPSNHPCSLTSFDVVKNFLAVAFRTVAGPHVELHQLSASHATIGTPSLIQSIDGIEVCDVALSFDGSRLVILTSLPDFSVKVFDTATKKCLHALNLVVPASRASFSDNSISDVLVYGSGIAQVIDFAASTPSVIRCEYVDGQSPLTAHSACFGNRSLALLRLLYAFSHIRYCR